MENNRIIGIIPCYNEENRLKISEFLAEIPKYPQLTVLFVNDGSKDNTHAVLESIHQKLPAQTQVLHLPQNGGKANAIFQGFQNALAQDARYIGYLDADLAVSIAEFMRVASIAHAERKPFVFGSRWRRLDADINRKLHRHLLGRVYATLASNVLNLPVYDTQCSAKVIDRALAEKVLQTPFHVNWTFDVEIFFRVKKYLGKEKFIQSTREIPLDRWIDVDGSKVSWIAGFKAFLDLLKLRKMYR